MDMVKYYLFCIILPSLATVISICKIQKRLLDVRRNAGYNKLQTRYPLFPIPP